LKAYRILNALLPHRYVLTDANFQIKAYLWIVVWLFVFTFDQIYIKYVVDTVPMTTWGRVIYSNAIAAIPVSILSIAQQEWAILFSASWGGYAALTLSCVMGLAMNYSAYWLRHLVSATSFTVRRASTCHTTVVHCPSSTICQAYSEALALKGFACVWIGIRSRLAVDLQSSSALVGSMACLCSRNCHHGLISWCLWLRPAGLLIAGAAQSVRATSTSIVSLTSSTLKAEKILLKADTNWGRICGMSVPAGFRSSLSLRLSPNQKDASVSGSHCLLLRQHRN
jgi:hypothetical protein